MSVFLPTNLIEGVYKENIFPAVAIPLYTPSIEGVYKENIFSSTMRIYVRNISAKYRYIKRFVNW
jgi:hypothetical protein